MKKLIIFAFILSVCIGVSACSGSKTDIDSLSSTVSDESGFHSSSTDNSEPSSDSADKSSSSYQANPDYMAWTFTDWKNSSQAQKETCLQKFISEVGVNIDANNLEKIFATNQDKNFRQIIELQKSIRSQQQSGTQPDPGHGAAAGLAE